MYFCRKEMIMCTKKTLYMAGDERTVGLRARERGGKLNFAQISYATDCVREVANQLDVPMAKVIASLRNSGAFQQIYREARKAVRRPAKAFARELVAM